MLQNSDLGQFDLVEVTLDKGVSERKMASDEKPWLVMQQIRRVGILRPHSKAFCFQAVHFCVDKEHECSAVSLKRRSTLEQNYHTQTRMSLKFTFSSLQS